VTRHSTLVQIQAGGTRPAFFCVHPSGGGVLCYAHLARQLGPEQPFYGFQSAGLDDEGALAESVEEMAARYVEELRGAQATGPYLLGGWSMGGLVALEMARQLRARGDEIALLALLDAPAPEKDAAPSVPDELTLMIHFALDLGVTHEALVELGGRVKLVNPDEQLAEVLELAKAADLVAPDVEPRVIRRLFNLFKANVRAMLNYRPPVWQGPLTLLVAEESEARAGDGGGARRWAEAARAVEVHSVPGSHFTMLREPHVRALAERLGECIERVGSPARRS
jgi:thioesterase domain-containing protein